MLEEQQLAQFKSTIENAQSVIVLLPQQADIDEVATAIGLHLSLREMGKESRLAAVTIPQLSAPELPGLDQVTTELGNQNLTISFDYKEEQVDKVSYHIGEETKKFYLTIKPRSGAAPLDTSSVEFSYTGAAADLLVFVGINSVEELQQLYYGYEELYENAVSISLSKNSSGLGQLNLTPQYESSLSELVASTFSALQFPIPQDSATNWLSGIEFATKGLTADSVEVGTFENIAALLKLGGIRQPFSQFSKNTSNTGRTELSIKKNNNGVATQQNNNSNQKSKKNKSSVMTS